MHAKLSRVDLILVLLALHVYRSRNIRKFVNQYRIRWKNAFILQVKIEGNLFQSPVFFIM